MWPETTRVRAFLNKGARIRRSFSPYNNNLEIDMRVSRLILALAALTVVGRSVSAQSLFVRNPSHYSDYGYGNSFWTTFTGMWEAKFGAPNITTGNSIGSLAGYTGLLLDSPNSGTTAYNMTPAEKAEIALFLAGGGRLFGLGENRIWAIWNTDLLSLFGASASGTGVEDATPLVANSLTAGVSSIDTEAPGNITDFNGGVNLFSNSFAGLFNSNSVVVLDVNVCDDYIIGRADNRTFCQNIVDFTAGGSGSVVPEPGSVVLLATGLLGFAGVVRHRRRVQRS